MDNRALKHALKGHGRVHLAGDALILVFYYTSESSAGIIFQLRQAVCRVLRYLAVRLKGRATSKLLMLHF